VTKLAARLISLFGCPFCRINNEDAAEVYIKTSCDSNIGLRIVTFFSLIQRVKMQCDNLNKVTLNDTAYDYLRENVDTNNSSSSGLKCENGILLPHWTPLENVSNGSIAFRGIVYIAVS
jgi:hypothetical protein